MPSKQNKLLLHNTIISIIVVTENDENIIQLKLSAIVDTIKELKTNYELLIIDNNSTDKTVKNVRRLFKTIPHIRIIVLSKKYDIFTAYSAGIDSCIGDYAIMLNIYTDPPRVIVKCIERLHENIDIIIGEPKPHLYNRTKTADFIIKLLEHFSTHDILDPTVNLFALNRKSINAITRTRRKSRNLAYIHSLIGLKKARIVYKPLTRHLERLPKQNVIQTLLFHADNIISHSYRPMRIVTYLGILLSSLFLLYVFAIVGLYFLGFRIAPQGWITLSVVMGTLFFLLFLLLSILGEYIIRILHESRNEPFYFVSEEFDKSIILPEDHKANIV